MLLNHCKFTEVDNTGFGLGLHKTVNNNASAIHHIT